MQLLALMKSALEMRSLRSHIEVRDQKQAEEMAIGIAYGRSVKDEILVKIRKIIGEITLMNNSLHVKTTIASTVI